jgi:hypothetical protein
MSNSIWEQTRGEPLCSLPARADPAPRCSPAGPPAAALHEDIERLERVIVKDFKQDVRTHKEKLMQSHRVRLRLDQIQESAQKLVSARCWPPMATPPRLAARMAPQLQAAASALAALPALRCSALRVTPRPAGTQVELYNDEDGARKEELQQLGQDVWGCAAPAPAPAPAGAAAEAPAAAVPVQLHQAALLCSRAGWPPACLPTAAAAAAPSAVAAPSTTASRRCASTTASSPPWTSQR